VADLDVTDLLVDPEMVEYACLPVTRALATIGENGRTQLAFQTLEIVASVQPASGTQLQRLPDLERASGAVQVYTLTPLIARAPGVTADVLRWHGADYTVETVSDYTAYGSGFVVAVCTLTSLAAGAGAGRVGDDFLVDGSDVGPAPPPLPDDVDSSFTVGESALP